MDIGIMRDLNDLDNSLCSNFATDVHSIQSFVTQLEPRLLSATADGQLAPSTLQYAANVLGRCDNLARHSMKIDQTFQDITKSTQQQYSNILSQGNPFQSQSSKYPSFPSPQTQAKMPYRQSESEFDYKAWRIWFLTHFANPYPSDKDNEWLLVQMPGKNNQQLLSWFSNLRKRSGWTDLNRLYAGGTPAGMQNLLDKIDSPVTSAYVKEDAKRMVEKVRRHIEQGAREAAMPSLAPQLGALVAPDYFPGSGMDKKQKRQSSSADFNPFMSAPSSNFTGGYDNSSSMFSAPQPAFTSSFQPSPFGSQTMPDMSYSSSTKRAPSPFLGASPYSSSASSFSSGSSFGSSGSSFGSTASSGSYGGSPFGFSRPPSRGSSRKMSFTGF